MSRHSRVGLCLALLLVASCDRGPGDPPGLEEAGPLVAEFAQLAKGLDTLAPALAARIGEAKLPGAVVDSLTRVGEAARKVLNAAEPEGSAGVQAVRRALADAVSDVVRHLVSAAGGYGEGPGRMVLTAPATIAFDTDAEPRRLDSDRSPEGMARGRERLRGDLIQEIEHFVYVALLANPDTRAALAPRVAPDDLPAEVPPDRNLPVATREEWRDELFDDHGRLVIPSPFDGIGWTSFLGWVEAVNPTLVDPVNDLTSPAFRAVR